jgi:hypothetical protein
LLLNLFREGNIVLSSDGAKTTSDPSYQPPPHGKGPCVTGKDCFNYNGTCSSGKCACIGSHTGTYCQLYRPTDAALSRQKERAALLKNAPSEKQQSSTFTLQNLRVDQEQKPAEAKPTSANYKQEETVQEEKTHLSPSSIGDLKEKNDDLDATKSSEPVRKKKAKKMKAASEGQLNTEAVPSELIFSCRFLRWR